MKSKGIVILAVAIVAIGIFALPSSVSLFSGQHTWYDLSESIEGAEGRNNVPCEKCHAEIEEEMLSGDNGAHEDLTCAMCHRASFTGYVYARGSYSVGSGGNPPTPGQEAHAASTVACMNCHGAHDWGVHSSDREYVGRCTDCHKGPIDYTKPYPVGFIAGGFGITPYAADTGTKAAHKKFVLDANESTLMEGTNEACVSCHTRIGVEITWMKNENLEFNATEDEYGIWTISEFAAGGSDVTYVNTNNTWTNP
ncbi:MAG: hypothetical protein WBE22_07260 [Halobacteriota archaeon]